MLVVQSGEMDEETRGSLLDQLFRTEQYVEMVLCYVRLSGQVSDYVIAEYDLDDIVRQAVRKFAPVFIRSRCRLVYEPLERTVLTVGTVRSVHADFHIRIRFSRCFRVFQAVGQKTESKNPFDKPYSVYCDKMNLEFPKYLTHKQIKEQPTPVRTAASGSPARH